jgi:hypothetical protein
MGRMVRRAGYDSRLVSSSCTSVCRHGTKEGEAGKNKPDGSFIILGTSHISYARALDYEAMMTPMHSKDALEPDHYLYLKHQASPCLFLLYSHTLFNKSHLGRTMSEEKSTRMLQHAQGKGAGFSKSSDIWHADGNVVLVTEKTAFHVHTIILDFASEVFRDMAAIPQPTEQDSSE